MSINRRAFLTALGVGISAVPAMPFGQGGRPLAPGEVRGAKPAAPPPPVRKAAIEKLFRTPDGHPNALDVTQDGFWIGEQVTDRLLMSGTLWMVASRLRALMQVNAQTFQPIVAHPFPMQRPHGLAWDNGAMWVVDGADEPRFVKMDAKTGATLEIIQLAAGDPDPHGLGMLNGNLHFCDAGIHPGWDRDKSPHTGWVCRVDSL